MKTYEHLYDLIKDIPVIDTHEHLPSWERNRDQNNDVLAEYLTHYFSCDLVSAGFRDLEKIRSGDYTVTHGIVIISAEGKYLGTIITPEMPANCAWGDNDFSTLYITARKKLYRIALDVEGFIPQREVIP